MVKLALCFSGDPRTYNKCFESIKNNLLDKFDCDVFVSTYNTDETTKNDILNLYRPKKYIFNNRDDIFNIVSKHLANVKDVKMIATEVVGESNKYDDYINNLENNFFDYNKFKNTFRYSKLSIDAICQFYGIYDVSKLCKEFMLENNISYDYILRIRLDDKVHNTFILNELKENEILINHIIYYSNSNKLQDHFFMAKPETFFKISSLYNDIDKIINFINNNECWLPTAGYQETLLLIQTIMYNIQIKTSSQTFSLKKEN